MPSENQKRSTYIKIRRLSDDLCQVPESVFSFAEAFSRILTWETVRGAAVKAVVITIIVLIFIVGSAYAVGGLAGRPLAEGHVVENTGVRPVIIAGGQRGVGRQLLLTALRDEDAAAEATDENKEEDCAGPYNDEHQLQDAETTFKEKSQKQT